MQDADVFVKTDAGRDEIKSRSRTLSMAERAILLMVDGQRDVAALRSIIAGSKAPADTLDALLAQGLIAGAGGAMAEATPVSIAMPRSATMARPSSDAMATAASVAAPPRFQYDGPLDLTLPTIYSPDDPQPVAPARSQPAPPPAAEPTGAPPQNRYEHLYTMMNDVVRDFLPAHRRYFIQLKIERASTAEELVELLDTLRAALAKARGDAFASEVTARLRAAAG